jgi:hypothetical protein
MRRILLAAVLLALSAGAAFAAGGSGGGGGSPNVGRNINTAVGPMAYPNAAELWAAHLSHSGASWRMGWTVPRPAAQPG